MTVMAIYFTSDLHFNNENILKYCKRPFTSVEHMNEELITKWNSVVTPEDSIFVLGDFIMGSSSLESLSKIINRLDGHIMLVPGNHDTNAKLKIYREHFSDKITITPLAQIKEYDSLFICSHYPMFMREWGDQKGTPLYCLSGHTHSKVPFDKKFPYNYNVGVDANNYKPVPFDKIKRELKEVDKKYVE